jgi:hypothetical protein
MQTVFEFEFHSAFSTTKTGRHDLAESGVKHNKSNQIKLNPAKITF